MKIAPFEPIDPELRKELIAIGDAAMNLWLNAPQPRRATEAERKCVAELFDAPLHSLPR